MNNILFALEEILGKSKKTNRGNYAFFCPICHHHKRKLEINLDEKSNNYQKYNCWTCSDFKGSTIKSLLKKIKIDNNKIFELLKGLSKPPSTDSSDDRTNSITLPKEFIPLYPTPNNIYARKVLSYLDKRNITQADIIKYNIGYCMDGKYHDRVIIPSYDINGLLNFFEARDITNTSSLRYLKPMVDKNEVIALELFINWDLPIILTEGLFDAITIKRNVIPLLGKTISNALMKKIVTSQVKKIYLALNSNALKTTLHHAKE